MGGLGAEREERVHVDGSAKLKTRFVCGVDGEVGEVGESGRRVMVEMDENWEGEARMAWRVSPPRKTYDGARWACQQASQSEV